MAKILCAVSGGGGSSSGNALVGQVLAGRTFSNDNGTDLVGTMVDNGAVSLILDTSTTSYTIPTGYHNGSGNISISTETKTAYATTSVLNITPSSGKVLSLVSIGKLSAGNLASGNILRGKTITVHNGSGNVWSVSGASNVLKVVNGTANGSGGSGATIYTDGGSGNFRTVNVNPGITPVYAVCVCGGGWVLWRSSKSSGNLGGPGLSGSYTTTDMGAWQSNAVSVFTHSSGGYWCYWWVFGY